MWQHARCKGKNDVLHIMTLFPTAIHFYTVVVRKSMLAYSFRLHHYTIVQTLDMEFTRSFIYPLVCLTTDPRHFPKPVTQRVRSSASSYNCQYPVFSSRSFVAVYVFFLVFRSLLSFRLYFIQ
jgi:hypothetical protein